MRKLLVMTVIALAALVVIAPRFVRWTTTHANAPVGTAALRLAALQGKLGDSSAVADSSDVKYVVMDWNMGPKITATLVAFTNGKTSLYVNPGKITTSENNESVKAAAERFISLAADKSDQFSTTADFDPPANGKVRFYIITRDGTFANRAELIVIQQNQNQTFHALLEAGQALASEMQRLNQ